MLDTTDTYKEWLVDGNSNWQAYIAYTAKSASSSSDWFYNNHLLSFEYNDGCVADVFELGGTYSQNIRFTLQNYNKKYSEYVFGGARLRLKLGLAPPNGNHNSENIQWLDKGYFNVVNHSSTKGKKIEIFAVDDMIKFNVPFTSRVSPEKSQDELQDGERPYITLKKLVINICKYCGVAVDEESLNFDNAEHEFPGGYYWMYGLEEKYTCRDMIGFVAQIAGGYARINNKGKLTICSFKEPNNTVLDYMGGTFLTATTPYSDGDSVNGGTFEFDYRRESWVEGGIFEPKTYHAINALYNIEASDYDRVFDGIVVESTRDGGSEIVKPEGSSHIENCISIRNNPLIYNGRFALALANALYDTYVLGKRRYRQLEAELPSDPSREAGDICVVSTPEGEQYWTIILNYSMKIGSGDVITSDFGMDSDISWTEGEYVATEESIEE